MRVINFFSGVAFGIAVTLAISSVAMADGISTAQANDASLTILETNNLSPNTKRKTHGDGRYTARVTSEDWGVVYVDALDSQRIETNMSLGALTRIAVKEDAIYGARFAQSAGRPPIVNFEIDEVTGDLYLLVEEGIEGQLVNAFVSTKGGETYHLMLSIREAPAIQILVRGGQYRESISVPTTSRSEVDADRLARYTEMARAEAALWHRNQIDVEFNTQLAGFDAKSLGYSNYGKYWNEALVLRNASKDARPFEKAAIVRPALHAIVSDGEVVGPGEEMVVLLIYKDETNG